MINGDTKPESKYRSRIYFPKEVILGATWLLAILILSYLIFSGGINQIKDNIGKENSIAELSIFLLRFTSILIPALPSTAYSLLAGGVLGFKKGLLVIYFADFISCSLCFTISRIYGRKVVRKLVGHNLMHRIEGFSDRNIEGNFFLMTGLLMTGLFDFVTYGIGLTKTSWKRFMPALIISILISDLPVVALGAGVLEGGRKILIISIIGVLILGIISTLAKNIHQKRIS